MKTSSEFIWQFIHSLSNAEKTYFRRNFSLSQQKKSKLYLQLFDAIAAQKKFNEEKIIDRFSPVLNKKNIAFQKHYLQTQLNNALVEYYSRNNVYQEIYKQIQLVRVYRKKGLLDEAHKLWKKAMANARQLHSFDMANLLKAEFEKMILFSSSHISYDELYDVFSQNAVTYAEYADMITLRDLYAEIVLIKRKVHYDLDDNQKARLKKLIKETDEYGKAIEEKSFWYRHYYFMSKATLLYLTGSSNDAFALLKINLAEWQKNNSFIISNGEHYLELLYMVSYAGIHCGEFAMVSTAFNKVCNNLIEDNAQRANFEAIKFLAINRLYNKTAQYDFVKQLLTNQKKTYPQWEPFLNNDINRTVNLSIGIASFVLEDYNDAIAYVKNAITYYKDGARDEHIAVGHLLLLLITYNTGNARLFDAQYRNTYSYFYKRKKKQAFETALIQCLHRSFYAHEHKQKLKEYTNALKVFEEDKNNIVQQMVTAIFNFPGWLQSRMMRISYRQFVEAKVKSSNMDSLS